MQLWAENVNASPQDPQATLVVPSSWLTPVANGLPPGWSLLANAPTVQWTRADDQGSQVVLQGTAGGTETFTKVSGVYMSPPGDTDYLSVDGNGHLQLSTSDDELYTFNPDGSLASMTTIADDRHLAALQYTYSGSPPLLRAITDPVSARSITLSYGGDAACPTAGQALVGNQPAPPGMLCQVSYWDGTSATFGYAGNTQLAQIASVTSSGGETSSFAYDSDNRLADIRDALANDYVASGGQPARQPPALAARPGFPSPRSIPRSATTAQAGSPPSPSPPLPRERRGPAALTPTPRPRTAAAAATYRSPGSPPVTPRAASPAMPSGPTTTRRVASSGRPTPPGIQPPPSGAKRPNGGAPATRPAARTSRSPPSARTETRPASSTTRTSTSPTPTARRRRPASAAAGPPTPPRPPRSPGTCQSRTHRAQPAAGSPSRTPTTATTRASLA